MHFFSVYSLFVSIGSLFVFCFPEEASDVGVKSMQSLPNVQVCNTEASVPFVAGLWVDEQPRGEGRE